MNHHFLAVCKQTCSMTSGAIQHGVPTNVFRTLLRVMSPPVARKALTPKSDEHKEKKEITFLHLWPKVIIVAGNVTVILGSHPIWKASYSHRTWRNNENDRWDNPKVQYLRSALSRHLREEYFQLLDPCKTQKYTSSSPLKSWEVHTPNQVNQKKLVVCVIQVGKSKYLFLQPF